ncbi:MAG: hypothetical protein R3C56_07400 [Pirellulaceae bacterium]
MLVNQAGANFDAGGLASPRPRPRIAWKELERLPAELGELLSAELGVWRLAGDQLHCFESSLPIEDA